MTLEEYIQSLASKSKLSGAKNTILRLLWESGEGFPRNWVASSVLLAATGQKYFDRRARELRDHLGCDLESKYDETLKEHAWRLKSDTLLNANPREYLSAVEKKKLFEAHNFTCSTCSKKSEAGVRGLQADHKIPLIRGGTHELSNWQPICNNCNVGKRRACSGCGDDCKKCPWAFPEIVGLRTTIDLPPELLSKLYDKAGGSHQKFNDLVRDALYKAIGNS